MKDFLTNFDELTFFDSGLLSSFDYNQQELGIGIDMPNIFTAGKRVQFRIEFYDVNKQILPIPAYNINIANNLPKGIYRFAMYPTTGVPANADYLRYTIRNFYNTSQVIASKFAKVCKVPQNAGIRLKWLNNLGGFDFYIFTDLQVCGEKVENRQSYNLYAERVGRVFSQNGTITIKTGANIPKNKVEGIRGLINSRQVYLVDYDRRFQKYCDTERYYPYVPIGIITDSIVFNELHNGYYAVEFEFSLGKQNI